MKIKNFFKKYSAKNNKSKIIKKLNFLYYPISDKNSINFYFLQNFETYKNSTNWMRLEFLNKKYTNILDLIKSKKLNFESNKTAQFKENVNINKYIYLYNIILTKANLDIFYFLKIKEKNKKKFIFYITISFKKNKIFINLLNDKKKTYISLSSGLFIKFFENKKSFKKNKTIKVLMSKYIRKIFLITKIKNAIMIIKKTPKLLNETVNFFNLPIAHKFLNPIENKSIEETNNNFIWIKFLYFIFMENKNFSKNKLPQKGRIKRKILRKVTFENKIID